MIDHVFIVWLSAMETFSGQGDQCKKYTDYLFAAKLHAAYAKVDFKVLF